MTINFKTGKTYSTRSIGDYNCEYAFEIIDRTAKTIKTEVYGKIVTKRVNIYNDIEFFRPFGNYSMAAIISADKESK